MGCTGRGAVAVTTMSMPVTATGEAGRRRRYQEAQSQQGQCRETHRGLLSDQAAHDDGAGLP